MANPLQEQQEILEELYHIVMTGCSEKTSSAQCRFEYDYGYDDGSESVNASFSKVEDGIEFYEVLKGDPTLDIIVLIPRLHKLMKAHTGGEWTAFTLFIEEDGSVRTKFEYPESATS